MVKEIYKSYIYLGIFYFKTTNVVYPFTLRVTGINIILKTIKNLKNNLKEF